MKNNPILFALVTIILLFQTGCGAQGVKSASPPHYDLHSPQVIKLSKEVDQISGLAYHAGDNSVFAIDDDHGNVYKIPLVENPKIEKWEFGKANDYEDLVLLNNQFYILSSKGRIVHFPLSFPVAKTVKRELSINGANEFETLYADPSAKRLVMLCKHCADDKKDRVSAYAFDLAADSFKRSAVFVLKEADIAKKLGKQITRFKPSAANINPLTGDVFIVSSVNKLLVIAGSDLSVKEVYELDPAIFKQPEGLCFTPGGNLLISNESARMGAATILIFAYKPSTAQAPRR